MLSLGAHLAGIVLLMRIAPLVLPPPPLTAPAIAVVFTAPASPPLVLAQATLTPAPAFDVLRAPQPVLVRAPAWRQVPMPAAPAPRPAVAPVAPAARAPAPHPPIAPVEEDSALYVADVQRAVQQAAAYPPLARQRRMQGRVQVRFALAHGTAHDVSITTASISPLLDRAALAAVARAHYPAVTRALTLVIWVDFSLSS